MHGLNIPEDFTPEVIPLVFLTFWEVGKWHHRLSEIRTDNFGRKNKAEFMSYWRRRFGVAPQKANAQVILRELGRLTNCSCTVFNKANPFV